MLSIPELVELIQLERIEVHYFRGQNFKAPWGRIFGGQVLAQALNAAYQTVPVDRVCHSLHGYFILAGDINAPVLYEVDEIRDGGSFTTRRVVAFQHGKAIFNMSASFQLMQQGFDHQRVMPDVTAPDALLSYRDHAREDPEKFRRVVSVLPKGVEFRPVEDNEFVATYNKAPQRHTWFRAAEAAGLPLPVQHQLLAYISDYGLLYTAFLPHVEEAMGQTVNFSSLDHAMWFHRPFKLEDWLLYATDSPNASNARGFTEGKIFSADGTLVASVAQEGLMRVKG